MITQGNVVPDELRLRVIAAKKLFPKYMDYIPSYQQMFGEMTFVEKTRVRAVWNCVAVDEEITANFEKLGQSFQ